MAPWMRIGLVTTLVAAGLSGLMVWGHFSRWWLVLILPVSLCLGLCGAMRDEDG
jgi:hypothetical protein